MAKKRERIVIDTNIWIAFLITRNFRKLDKKIQSGEIKVVFSQELMEEFITVTNRPKFKRYFSKEDVQALLDLFEVYGEVVEVNSIIDLCRDKKDNFLLALAKDAKADYLITGDSDLLELKKVGKTKILEISNYLKLI